LKKNIEKKTPKDGKKAKKIVEAMIFVNLIEEIYIN
jgi:hypothetical protein